MATGSRNPLNRRRNRRLSVKAVERIEPGSKPFKVGDGKGLHLLVTPKGSKLWRFSYRFGGKQKTLSMGAFPEVAPAEARDRRDEARRMLRDGIDPSAARKEAKAAQVDVVEGVFGYVAAEWLAKCKNAWTESTYDQTRSRLDNDILPYLKDRPVKELAAPELMGVAQRVVDRGAIETARRITRIMRQILQHAVLTGRLQYNPAAGLVQALPSVKARHMPALTQPDEVAGLLRAIHGYQGEPAVRAALMLAPLVFVRPGELRGARWEEFDLEAGRWEIPGSRMKMGEPLTVPLSDQAVAILEGLHPLTGKTALVFVSTRTRTRPISDNTLNAALRRMGFTKAEMTAHGFRAMARTMLEEQLGFRYELIEQQLGHVVRDPNGRAYNRTKNLPERTSMMQAWADYLDRLREGESKVTQMRPRA